MQYSIIKERVDTKFSTLLKWNKLQFNYRNSSDNYFVSVRLKCLQVGTHKYWNTATPPATTLFDEALRLFINSFSRE